MRPILGAAILLLGLGGCMGEANQGNDSLSRSRSAAGSREPSRSFHIRYITRIDPVTSGRKFRLWIPVPSSDVHQTIADLKVQSPLEYRLTTEPVHGNRMVYVEDLPPSIPMEIVVEYEVDRYPYQVDLDRFSSEGRGRLEEKYLQASRLGVVNEDVRSRAARLSAKDEGTLVQARAFYQYVADEMTYGKPDDLPWGRGDTVYACGSRVGNCTDFHSYFISLCLAQ